MKSKGAKARREKRVVSAAKRLKEHTTGFERTTLKLPDGVNFFTPKEPGTYRLEIIPFKVGKGNKYFEEGSYAFERTYWNHRGIGAESNSYVCPAKTAGKKCPICEHRAKLAQDPNADEELVKSLAPKERQLFNVYDHKHPDKGVQVWDVSHYLFGKHLDNKIKNADPEDRERYEQFANEEDGLTLRITASQESMGSNTFLDFSDIEFKERKEALDPELFDQAVCLDDCLKVLDYKELKKILLQLDDEDTGDAEDDDTDDDDDDTPKKKKKPVAEEDDDEDTDADAEDEDDDEDDDGNSDNDEDELTVGSMVTGKYKKQPRTGQIKKITKGDKGQKLAHVKVRGMDQLWIADLSELSPVEPGDEEDDDSDDDDTPPAKKGKGKPAAEDDDDLDLGDDDDDLDLGDDDDDDDTTPPPKKKGGKKPTDDDDDLPFDLDDDEDDEPDPTPKDKGKGKRKVK